MDFVNSLDAVWREIIYDDSSYVKAPFDRNENNSLFRVKLASSR